MSEPRPAFMRMPEWCRFSGMARSATYDAIAAGNIIARKVGERTFIDVEQALGWMNSLPRAKARLHSTYGKNGKQAA